MQSHQNMFMHETNHNPNNNNNNNNFNNNYHKNNNIKAKTTSNTIPRHHGSTTTTQACVACKYQRRKCASDCILAPYFPHDRQRQFLNAHRLFGVSNIIKIVRHLDNQAKDKAMRTIIFQSDARAADPVGGCYRIIRDLEDRISLVKAELEVVLHHLAICRAAAATTQNHNDEVVPPAAMEVVDDVDGSWGSCMHGEVVHSQLQHAESTSSSFPHENNGGYDHHHNHLNHVRRLSMEDCDNDDDDDDFRPILDQLGCGDDDDLREEEMIKFDCNGNVLTSNNAILSENNGILSEDNNMAFKEDDDCFPYVEENDLKAAATFFSLTNSDI